LACYGPCRLRLQRFSRSGRWVSPVWPSLWSQFDHLPTYPRVCVRKQQESLEASTAQCAAETINNLLAVFQSACDGRNQTRMDTLQGVVESLARTSALQLYPGLPGMQVETNFFAQQVLRSNRRSGFQLQTPGLGISLAPDRNGAPSCCFLHPHFVCSSCVLVLRLCSIICVVVVKTSPLQRCRD